MITDCHKQQKHVHVPCQAADCRLQTCKYPQRNKAKQANKSELAANKPVRLELKASKPDQMSLQGVVSSLSLLHTIYA